MATAASYVIKHEDMVVLEHAHMGGESGVYGIARPGGLRWLGPRMPRMSLGWQGLKREMQPLKIRWGWALFLAVVIVVMMGECGPAASALAPIP